MAGTEGVQNYPLPQPPQRYDEQWARRLVGQIDLFMQAVSGRFQNDNPVTTEAWEGGALIVSNALTPTSDSTILERARNGIFFIDAVLDISAGAGTELATFVVSVDPDGSGSFATAATYAYPVNASTEGVTFVMLAFTSSTAVQGGEVRISGSGAGAGDWTATLTPSRVRGM